VIDQQADKREIREGKKPAMREKKTLRRFTKLPGMATANMTGDRDESGVVGAGVASAKAHGEKRRNEQEEKGEARMIKKYGVREKKTHRRLTEIPGIATASGDRTSIASLGRTRGDNVNKRDSRKRRRGEDDMKSVSIKTRAGRKSEKGGYKVPDDGSMEAGEDDKDEIGVDTSDEDPAVDAIGVAVKRGIDAVVEDLLHKTGPKVGKVECKGYMINPEDRQRRKCTCLSLYNEEDEIEKERRLDTLVLAVATWMRKGTFKVEGYLKLRKMSEREKHFRESLFCCFSTSKLLCTVDLTNLFGKKKWHVHLQMVEDNFFCLATFLRLFTKIEQEMEEITESLIEVGGYNANDDALKRIKEEGTRRFVKQHNASLMMAFAKMGLRKERKNYDELSEEAGDVRTLEGRQNAYDYLAIEKIARLYMEGLNPEKEDLTSVIDT
jgi:hypothetical protein